jgi:DNA-binding transcriptional LysR family regulator
LLLQLKRHGLEPVIGQLADSPEEQIDLTIASAGLCMIPASTMHMIAPGQLRFRPIPALAMELDVSLGWRRDPASGAAADLLACLQSAIDGHQAGIANATPDWARLDGHPVYAKAR